MSFHVVPETQRCSDCGNLVPSANFALHAGRCRGPSPAAAAEDESSHASKKAKAEFAVPADAQQVDLTNSDDDDEGAGNAALNAAQIAADAKLAAELASEGHYAADAQLAAQLASDGDYVGAPFGVLVSGDRPPWSARSDWYEMQHPPGGCGNFDNCTKTGGSYFATDDGSRDETSHGLEPRPLPGQTLRIHYKPHKLSPTPIMKGAVPVRRDHDGTTKVIEARTKAYAPFTMPRFAGHIETYELGPAREAVYVLRNFDGSHGAELAARLEACFGLDILDQRDGTSAKCAAAQGNNCQDNYTKLYPLRMFADDQRFELLQPLLDATMAAVNDGLPPSAPKLSLQRGDRPGKVVTGEAQILRFRAAARAGVGDRMHVHVDKRGTRWVALMAVGDSSTFVFDHAPSCQRCYTGGGQGTGKQQEWHKKHCPSCKEITLASGDCLLFFGDPDAGVAHGSLGTQAKTAPSGLPAWATRGGRVSCQYRLSAGFTDARGMIY
jgi:hypothetical protein